MERKIYTVFLEEETGVKAPRQERPGHAEGATIATMLRNESKKIETLAVGDSAKKSGFHLRGKSESLEGFEQGSKMKRAV